MEKQATSSSVEQESKAGALPIVMMYGHPYRKPSCPGSESRIGRNV
jgi:hypothetical protein